MPSLDVHINHRAYRVFQFVEEEKARRMLLTPFRRAGTRIGRQRSPPVIPSASKWTSSVRLGNQRLAEINRSSNVLVARSGIGDQAQLGSVYAIRSSLMAAASGMIELMYVVMLPLLAHSAVSTERVWNKQRAQCQYHAASG